MPNFLRALLITLVAFLPLQAVAETTSPLFEFVATDTDDKPVALSDLKGKPLVVNFWARWCGPCRTEIPDLVKMNARYRQKGIVILGMAVEENTYREAVRDFAKAYDIDYRVLLTGTDKGVELMSALGNDKTALPFTVVIDRSGKLVTKKLGAMSSAEMDAAIKTALK